MDYEEFISVLNGMVRYANEEALKARTKRENEKGRLIYEEKYGYLKGIMASLVAFSNWVGRNKEGK